MRRVLAMTIVLAAGMPISADDGTAGIVRFVDGLRSEADDCAFLRRLCVGARASLGREVETPPSADVLASRQAGIAAARVRDAVTAARAIERKRGRRLACFEERACQGIVPPSGAPARSTGSR